MAGWPALDECEMNKEKEEKIYMLMVTGKVMVAAAM